MVFKFERIFESVPILFAVLVNDFCISMKIELTLVFAKTDVVNVVEEKNDFFAVASAKGFDLTGDWLLFKKTCFNDKNMAEYFKLP